MAKTSKKKPAKKKPAKRAKAVKLTPIDELSAALQGMVTAAEASGGRDNPEVGLARQVLAKHRLA